MNDNQLKINMWNVRGLGDPFRGETLKKWANHFHKDLGVLCLKDLKSKRDKIEFQLKTLFSNNAYKVHYTGEGRAGVAIMTMPHLKVLNKGSYEDGPFAWCKIETGVGHVHVRFVYALEKWGLKIGLWD